MADDLPHWRRYYFAAAVLPKYAALYPTLTPGKYYPMMIVDSHRDRENDGNHWLAPSADPATWVLVKRMHAEWCKVVEGDAWEGERIGPLGFPD